MDQITEMQEYQPDTVYEFGKDQVEDMKEYRRGQLLDLRNEAKWTGLTEEQMEEAEVNPKIAEHLKS